MHVIDPLPQKHAENVELMKREIDHPGLSVIIPTRACIHLRKKLRERTAAIA
jgi:indolepyruvate ferredoxin oxidoreductase alpha subunit